MVWGLNPVGARFSAPLQTGPEANRASCTTGSGSLYRGFKRPQHGVDRPPTPTSAEVEERGELYLHFPSMSFHGLFFGELKLSTRT